MIKNSNTSKYSTAVAKKEREGKNLNFGKAGFLANSSSLRIITSNSCKAIDQDIALPSLTCARYEGGTAAYCGGSLEGAPSNFLGVHHRITRLFQQSTEKD